LKANQIPYPTPHGDGNVVELHHKDRKKEREMNTKAPSLLDKQTANKRTKHMLIEKANNAFHPPKSLFPTVHSSVEETETNSNDFLSAEKMAYLANVGLCFTNVKGNVLKKYIQCMSWNIL
jgi:hypothetical protein